jgi:hypothetical protein
MPLLVCSRASWDDRRVPDNSGLTVDVPEGRRWELALELLESGEASVRVGGVEMHRHTNGPTADWAIHLAVRVPELADKAVGRQALDAARVATDELTRTDARFAALLDRFGYRFDIVHDYGMGTALLGEAIGRGDLVWLG